MSPSTFYVLGVVYLLPVTAVIRHRRVWNHHRPYLVRDRSDRELAAPLLLCVTSRRMRRRSLVGRRATGISRRPFPSASPGPPPWPPSPPDASLVAMYL